MYQCPFLDEVSSMPTTNIRKVFFGPCFANVMMYDSPKLLVNSLKASSQFVILAFFCQVQDQRFYSKSETAQFTSPWNFYLENSTITTFYSWNSTVQVGSVLKVVGMQQHFFLCIVAEQFGLLHFGHGNLEPRLKSSQILRFSDIESNLKSGYVPRFFNVTRYFKRFFANG